MEYEIRDTTTGEYISLGKILGGKPQMSPEKIAAFVTDDKRIGHAFVFTTEDVPCGSSVMGGQEVDSWDSQLSR